MATVTLQRLRKEYRGGAVAVRDLSLEIADGEFLALVGPSGCGKSTTLNMIAGLDAPTSGAVLIDGRDVTAESPGARDIAMVFQSYALYPHLDVRGNLAFPLQVARRPRGEIDRRVREAAAMLGLEDLLSRKPRELSGGQRQRVALGRALVREPKVFLFDEPLSNLDAGLRLQLRADLKLLHDRLRTTFIYVTHDQGEAMTLASRIVVMDRGEVRQAATPREIYERPASRFVAELFGSPRINIVAPEVLGLPARAALVGVRPESLEIIDAAPSGLRPSHAAAPGVVEGVVRLVELTGAESWVSLDLAGQRLVARAAADFAAAPGTTVRVRARKLLWFDAQGGAVPGDPACSGDESPGV
jgi:multiple sugar transport system ATP-binding protein